MIDRLDQPDTSDLKQFLPVMPSFFKSADNCVQPLIKSTIFAVFILLFIEYWNDYYTPMVFLPENPTMSYGLFLFQTDNKASVPVQLSACLLACLPTFAVLF